MKSVDDQISKLARSRAWNRLVIQMNNRARNQVWGRVGLQVLDQIWGQVGVLVREQMKEETPPMTPPFKSKLLNLPKISNQIFNITITKVRSRGSIQVWDRVWIQSGNRIWSQIKEENRDSN